MQKRPVLVSILIIVTCMSAPLLGVNFARGLEENSIEWSFTTIGRVRVQPAICDLNGDNNLDVVLISRPVYPETDGYVYALDGITGEPLWSYYLEQAVTFSAPVIGDIDNDAKPEVIVQVGLNILHAFNGEDGSLIWSISASSSISESQPFISDFDADMSLELVAGNCVFNASNGELLDQAGSWAEAIIMADYEWDGIEDILIASRIYVMEDNDTVLKDAIQVYSYNNESLSLKDTIIFENVTGGMFDLEYVDVTQDERREFILFTYEEVIAMDNESREILWIYHVNDTYSIMNSFVSSAPISDMTGDHIPDVILGTCDGEVLVLSGNNGSPTWIEEMYVGGPHPITLSDIDDDSRDEIPVIYSTNEVRILDGEDGWLLWSYRIPLCSTNPVIEDMNNDGVYEAVVGFNEGIYTVSIQGAGRDYIPPNWTSTTTTTSTQTSTSTHTTSTTVPTLSTTTTEPALTTSTTGTTTTVSTTTTEPPQIVDVEVVITGIAIFVMISATIVLWKRK